MKPTFVTACFTLLTMLTAAQDSAENKAWVLSGYIKDMANITFIKDVSKPQTGNLLHNRINIKWQPDSQFTAALELRNRLYFGNGPGINLRNTGERIDASKTWADRNDFVSHSTVDRFWLQWVKRNWSMRIGRQRLNWGLTSIWNPNDVFNPYNFLDFDYEERPGTDAVNIQYTFNDASQLEIAVSPSHKKNNTIAAARYLVHKWGYDLQVISGVYYDAFTFGFGWAGKLGNIGYKAEGQAYIRDDDTVNRFNYSWQLDYTIGHHCNISAAVLHSTTGLSKPVSEWSKLSYTFSPEQLMPAQWTFIANAVTSFTPAFSGDLKLVFSPGVNMFILFPSLKYRLSPDLDADLLWQSYFLEMQRKLENQRHQLFLRLKWSF